MDALPREAPAPYMTHPRPGTPSRPIKVPLEAAPAPTVPDPVPNNVDRISLVPRSAVGRQAALTTYRGTTLPLVSTASSALSLGDLSLAGSKNASKALIDAAPSIPAYTSGPSAITSIVMDPNR